LNISGEAPDSLCFEGWSSSASNPLSEAATHHFFFGFLHLAPLFPVLCDFERSPAMGFCFHVQTERSSSLGTSDLRVYDGLCDVVYNWKGVQGRKDARAKYIMNRVEMKYTQIETYAF